MSPRFPNLNPSFIQFSAAYLALSLMANPADAQPNPGDKNADFAGTGVPWFNDVEAILKARYDPIKRTIICRVANTDIVISALIEGTDVSQSRMKHAIDRLKSRRLVQVGNNAVGERIITPTTDEAREKMKRWAPFFCR